MSVILALDSSGDALSVALNKDGEIICRICDDGTPHSDVALPMLTTLLSDNGVRLADCDAFAFAAGPGKFSALRLVCAISKTLAYTHNKALIAVPTLAALAAANVTDDAITAIKCALPAHREHVYFATCRKTASGWRCPSPSVISVAAPPPALKVQDACGAGFVQYPQLLAGAHHHNTAAYSNAAAVAQLAEAMYAANDTTPPLVSEPLYVRKNVALTVAQRLAKKATKLN